MACERSHIRRWQNSTAGGGRRVSRPGSLADLRVRVEKRDKP